MEHAMQTQEQRDISSLEESLRLGQSLHLEFEGLPTLNGGYSLWGVCPNESIMVSALQLELSQPLLNMPVKARLFIKHLDSACAFRTSVSYLSPSASPYVHLLMPTRVIRGEA